MNSTAPLMAHLVLGHPTLPESLATARRYAAAGVRYVEVQLPFSHPTADGVTITAANRTALAATPDLADYWTALRALAAELPPERLVLMTYANRIVGGGVEAFVAQLRAVGIRQLIVPDLPLDAPAAAALLGAGLDLFPVLAPNVSAARLERLLTHQPAFVYIMAGYRLTGQAFDLDPRLAALVAAIRQRAPQAAVGIGFGVRTGDDVRAILAIADVAIVGSALLQAQSSGALTGLLDELVEATRNPA